MANLYVVQAIPKVSPNNSSATTTTAAVTTLGNLLVAMVGSFGNHIGASPISDSKGNTWVQAIGNFGTSESWGAMFYCANPTVGAGHTFTATLSGADYISLVVFDIANAATSSVLGNTSAQTMTTSPRSSGSITAASGFNQIFVGGLITGRVAIGKPLTQGEAWFSASPVSAGGTTMGYGASYRYADHGISDSYTNITGAGNNTTVMVAGFNGTETPAGGGALPLIRPGLVGGPLIRGRLIA